MAASAAMPLPLGEAIPESSLILLWEPFKRVAFTRSRSKWVVLTEAPSVARWHFIWQPMVFP
jgi:hypothetical protein